MKGRKPVRENVYHNARQTRIVTDIGKDAGSSASQIQPPQRPWQDEPGLDTSQGAWAHNDFFRKNTPFMGWASKKVPSTPTVCF